MAQQIILPPLGDGIVSATIVEWLVKEGEFIEVDMDVVEIATDKATFCVPSVVRGRLSKIMVQPGTEQKIGCVLALIEEDL